MEELDCFSCGECFKGGTSRLYKRIWWYYEHFCYICNQINLFRIFNPILHFHYSKPSHVMLQITSIIWANKYNDWNKTSYVHVGCVSTWHIILGFIKEYFITSQKLINMAWKYSKNIQWYGMKYLPKILSCSFEPIHWLTTNCSLLTY